MTMEIVTESSIVITEVNGLVGVYTESRRFTLLSLDAAKDLEMMIGQSVQGHDYLQANRRTWKAAPTPICTAIPGQDPVLLNREQAIRLAQEIGITVMSIESAA